MNSTKSFLTGALALSFDHALRKDMAEETELQRIAKVSGTAVNDQWAGHRHFAYPWPVKVRNTSLPLKQRKARAKARAKARRQRKLNNKRK